jgi:hypothetical protein
MIVLPLTETLTLPRDALDSSAIGDFVVVILADAATDATRPGLRNSGI